MSILRFARHFIGLLLLAETVEAAQLFQTLTWTGTTNIVLPLNTINLLGATSSVGLAVTVRIQSGPALVTNGTITVTAPGTIWVVAEQAGTTEYQPAKIKRSFNVRQALLKRIASYGGSCCAFGVQVVGNLAYVAAGSSGLHIIDVSNPANPVRLGQYAAFPGWFAGGVQVVGNYAYVIGERMLVFDITNPANPARVGEHSTTGNVNGIKIRGQYAYLADAGIGAGATSAGLHVVNVSDPAHPVAVGFLRSGSHPLKVDVVGNLVYLADLADGLQIIDVAIPSSPARLSSMGSLANTYDVKVFGNRAYLAEYDAGVHIVDVTNPANPASLGIFNTPGHAVRVDVAGDYLFVADNTEGVQVIDVSEPATPLSAGSHPFNNQALSVHVAGNHVYVVGGSGMDIFKVSLGLSNTLAFSPPASIPVTTISIPLPPASSNGKPVFYAVTSGPARVEGGQLIFTAAGIVQLRATQPDDGLHLPIDGEWTISVHKLPQTIVWTGTTNEVLTLNTPYHFGAAASSGLPVTVRVESGPAVIANGAITVTGEGTVWVTVEQAGNGTYSPAEPLAQRFNLKRILLTRVGGYNTESAAFSVQVVGNYAFVADGGDGLQVINVSNPAAPSKSGGAETPDSALGVNVVGDYAYVADYRSGLHIIDVRDPANPTRAGGLALGGRSFDVRVVGNYAYVAAFEDGIIIIDVSSPSNPRFVSAIATPGDAQGITVDGDYAYVADRDAGLQIIDIRNPASPVLKGRFQSSDQSIGIEKMGPYAYVADGSAGLQIINVSDPANPVRVAGYNTDGFACAVKIFGNHAFVADELGGTLVLDISNPLRPAWVGGISVSHETQSESENIGLHIVGDYAYVASYAAGLEICKLTWGYPQSLAWTGVSGEALSLNTPHPFGAIASSGLPITLRVESGPAIINKGMITITNFGMVVVSAEQKGSSDFFPAARLTRQLNLRRAVLSRMGGYDTLGVAVAVSVSGNYAYVADALGALDAIAISNPANPIHVGRHELDSDFAADVQVSGNYAYVSMAGLGFQIVNISNPTNMARVANVATTEYTRRGHVTENLAYMAGSLAGMEIFDITDPTNTARLASSAEISNGFAIAVKVVGNFAYVLDSTAPSLKIFNVSNPANLALVGAIQLPGAVRDLHVVGDYAYLAGGLGLQIVNVSNPAAPTLLGSAPTGGRAMAVQVAGSYAYVASATMSPDFEGPYTPGGVQVIDVGDPANPIRLGGVTGLNAMCLQIAGGYAYVAAHTDGLQVYKISFTEPGLELATRRIGAQWEISWLAGIAGVTLETTTSLASNSEWQPVTALPTETGGFARVQVDSADRQRYFRLLAAP